MNLFALLTIISTMIVVDSGSIISLAVNCLCPLFEKIERQFITTPAVFYEIVTKPAGIKRFALESMRIQNLFNKGIIKTFEVDNDLVKDFMDVTNNTFHIRGKPLKIIHKAEAEALILAKEKNAKAYMIDERTMRLLVEDIYGLKRLLEHRNHKPVHVDKQMMNQLTEYIPDIPLIRSTEMVAVAYEKGILSNLLQTEEKKALTASLQALKIAGCSITWEEIQEYDKFII